MSEGRIGVWRLVRAVKGLVAIVLLAIVSTPESWARAPRLDSAPPARGSLAAATAPVLPPPDLGPDTSLLDVAEHERLLVIAPHPDDETLGAGALIQRVLARGGTVRIVWVTAGDGYVEAVEHATGELRPRASEFVAYGERRIGEAHDAARILAGKSETKKRHTDLLGFPDGGLLPLLRDHWARIHPERSSTTDASRPPYREADDSSAPYDGADLRRELKHLVSEARPTLIAFPDPADKHPDHHAAGIFTLLAVDDWADAHDLYRKGMPRVLAYMVHWPGWPPGWDQPVDQQDLLAPLHLPTYLPDRGLPRVALALTPAEIEIELKALAAHKTQQQVMPRLLRALVRPTVTYTEFTGTAVDRLTSSIEREIADFEKGLPAPPP